MEDPLDSAASATGAVTRHPSASLAIEASEADGFLVLEQESTPLDADFGDFSDEALSGASGFPALGVPQPASLTQVPDSGDPSKPGEIR